MKSQKDLLMDSEYQLDFVRVTGDRCTQSAAVIRTEPLPEGLASVWAPSDSRVPGGTRRGRPSQVEGHCRKRLGQLECKPQSWACVFSQWDSRTLSHMVMLINGNKVLIPVL